MVGTLPFIVGNTNDHDKCHRCTVLISRGIQIKGTKRSPGKLKMGAMNQSSTEDAKVPLWFHVECFVKQFRHADESKIQNFATLSNTDKATIQRHMKKFDAISTKPNIFAKKRPHADTKVSETITTVLSDFRVELSGTADNICRCCFKPIAKGKVGIIKIVAGTINLWYHANCFEKCGLRLGWNEAVEKFPGFDKLRKDYKRELESLFKTKVDENNNEPDTKRLKLGDINDVNSIIDEKIKSQNTGFSRLRNELKRALIPDDYVDILQKNDQFIPTDPDKVLDHVTDVIWFGALNDCKECKTGKFVFDGNGSYVCNGTISSYAKCTNQVKIPGRRTVQIPKKYTAPCLKTKFKPKIRATKLPSHLIESIGTRLFGFDFVVDPKVGKSKREIEWVIQKMKGRVGHFVGERTAAVISDAEGIEEMGPYLESARQLGIQVVPVEFLDAVKISEPFSLIKEMNLSPWQCTDPSQRIPRNGISATKPDDFYIDAESKVQKWKNGITIDADCKLENVHVHSQFAGYNYMAIMALVDIPKDKNSYHRMQLLVSDDEKRFWIFQKSGRIGTIIGKSEQQECNSIEHAEQQFRTIFQELTGNDFNPFAPFEKKPDKYQLLKIECEARKDVLKSLVPSHLEARKYGLMKLICDKKAMKDTMLSFDLDTTNMPLGKLSKAQIDIAMDILKEISTMVDRKASHNEFVEASNRFYTMIPHTFVGALPIINTTDQIDKKMDMLKHLANIRLTYSLLNGTDKGTNPLDHLYKQLNAHIAALDRTSPEYREIDDYVQLTKLSTQKLTILNAFAVSRAGEKQRFDAFKHLPNRQLLWHGSNLTNFVGLLSKGMKIAPPDARSNGTNFGRGLYFADAITKSLNYCSYTGKMVALLLLCEVALGTSLEVTAPQPITLPSGMHSTKCLGERSVSGFKTRPDGLLIPSGRKLRDQTMEMPYNEFIVYDESQVQIKYLVKVKLEHNLPA